MANLTNYPKINPDKVEQQIGAFYGRITDKETKTLDQLVIPSIVEYMDVMQKYFTFQPYLIAGVGGILRKENPEEAKDIDLAVVGFPISKDFCVQHIERYKYNAAIRGYFDFLKRKIKETGYNKNQKITFGKGSGLEYLDEQAVLSNNEKDVVLNFSLAEKYLEYSIGLQIRPSNHRPIDIQFVLEKSIEKWIADQEEGKVNPETKIREKTPFYYSVIHASR